MKDSLNTVTELKGFKHVNANLITVESRNFYQGSHMFKGEARECSSREGVQRLLKIA